MKICKVCKNNISGKNAKYCSLKCMGIDRVGKKTRPPSEETRKLWSFQRKGSQVGSKNHNWKGGKKLSHGYVYIYKPEHPFSNRNGIREHRVVVEAYLGRYLTPKEAVHHINGIRTDNRIQNLMVFTGNPAHTRFEHGNQIDAKDIIFDGRTLL